MEEAIDIETIKKAAEYSKKVYYREGFSKNEKFYEDAGSDTQCLVVKEGKTIYIVFRGTTNTKDWVTNLNIIPIKTPFGKIHGGFYGAWKKIYRVLLGEANISDLIESSENVVICGHSLGGALSSICAAALAMYHPNQHFSCITFGGPRVGSRSFRKYFNKMENISCKRFAVQADPVPRIPSCIFYRHVNDGVILDRHLTYCGCLLDISCSPTDDHDMDNYLSLIYELD